MASRLDRVSKTVGEFVRLLAIGGGIMLLCLMVLTVVAVTLRKFNNPILDTQDLSDSGLVIVVYFAMAYSGWTGGHIAVDLIGGFVKPRTLNLMDTTTRAISGGFFLIVAWQSMRRGWTRSNLATDSTCCRSLIIRFSSSLRLGPPCSRPFYLFSRRDPPKGSRK